MPTKDERINAGVDLAEQLENVLKKAMMEMMDVVLSYDGKLTADDAITITKIVVEKFSLSFDKAAKLTNKFFAERKNNNNQT